MITRRAGQVVAFLVATFAVGDPAAAAVCAASQKPVKVSVKSDPGKVLFKTGHGRADLKRMQQGSSRGRAAGGMNPLGLTLTDFRFSIKTTVRLSPLGGGRYCASPESFEMNIGFSDFLVYIDRRYKRGTCEYRAIRKHENTHVSLYRAYLARHLPELRSRAEIAARRIKPAVVGSTDGGAKYIQDKMQSSIKPIIDRISREADAANAKIDTQKSYRYVQSQCNGW